MSYADRIRHARRMLGARSGEPGDLDRLAVSLRAVGRLLSISPSMVEKLVASGELPSFRAGRAVRVQLVDLVEFMERNRRAAAQPKSASARARAVALIEGSDESIGTR